ncbi:MAG: hypothetical protein KGJ35_01200 [Patescibacteria group bacterium]|nr:hypothetical protein [Patescibacteria group bacterium]
MCIEPLSATNITLSIQYIEGKPLIVMVVDGEQYIMLTVKRNILAAKTVEALRNDFSVNRTVIGIAFNYKESVQNNKLVIFSDPTINGIYVPYENLIGEIRQMLGK